MVGHLFQRKPLPVPPRTLSASAAQAAGTNGSTTTLERIGTFSTIQSRASWRVSARASTRSLWTENTSPCAHSSAPSDAGHEAVRRRTRGASQTAAATTAHAASRHSSG